MKKHRIMKLSIWILTGVVLIAGLVFGGGYILFIKSVPDANRRVAFAALNDSVQITYDSMGIPQIWAQNERDVCFATGYLHAADRLFQMDLTRRVSHGRLSELFGKIMLDLDKQQRTIGHTRLARKFLPLLADADMKRLQAYADGVNAYVESCDALPFEYYLLQKEVEKWDVLDCLTIFSFQTWFSNALMNKDEFYLRLAEKVGMENAYRLLETYPALTPFTVPDETPENITSNSWGEILGSAIFSGPLMPFQMSHSSNSWVVAPHRSQSGSAMLASDPHLEISRLPQFWYFLGVHSADTGSNALGITAPGLPFITMGHNGRCAWAFTVGGIDVNDYYTEKIDEADSSRYLTADGWQPFDIINDSIHISGDDQPVPLKIKTSRHGPVMFADDSLKQAYSLRWAGFDADLSRSISAVFHLKDVANFEDFRTIITQFGALDANWTYADSLGNIGYQLGTPLPVRPEFDGSFALPGWEERYDWQGYQPLNNTPHALNPERGWLATCNNKQHENPEQAELRGTFAADRILRISELLESQDKFSVKDLQGFQMDLTDKYLLKWKNRLADCTDAIGEKSAAIQLRNWDGTTGTDSRETALTILMLDQIRHRIFDDELGNLAGQVTYLMLDTVWNDFASIWYDDNRTPEKESRQDILEDAARKAFKIWNGRQWGELHTFSMTHPLALIPLISPLLSLKSEIIPWHGTAGTLNASFFLRDKKKEDQFQVVVGPSWRFVIDFAAVDSATFVLPAGNSGNPASPHFMDFHEMWKLGQRWNVPISRAAVEKRVTARTILKPLR